MSENYDKTPKQEERLKSVTVKIISSFEGTSNSSIGTGVIYNTSESCEFFYVITALHCLFGKRDGETFPHESSLSKVLLSNMKEDGTIVSIVLKRDNIIPIYEKDLGILIVPKNKFKLQNSHSIIVGNINRYKKFNSFGYPSFSTEKPEFFDFWRKTDFAGNDDFTVECMSAIDNYNAKDKISGYSGSGLFYENTPILVGVFSQIVDEEGFAGLLSVKKINVGLINKRLKEHNPLLEYLENVDNTAKITLDNENNSIVNYEKMVINGIELNIWRALKRLKNDLRDDWFQDPLNFKYLLSKKFFYERIKNKSNNLDNYYEPTCLAKHYTIPKAGFSTRPSIEVSFIDRIIYQAYADKLGENLDSNLSNQIYSFRNNSGKGSGKYFFHYSIEQWKKYIYQTKSQLTEEKPFLVVADITNFFENINLTLLKGNLDRLIDYTNDIDKTELKKVVDALHAIIKKWNTKQVNVEFGIPQNRDASSYISNLFLHEIDNAMINSLGYSYYYRYMDDVRIVCKTESEARKAVYDLSKIMRKIGLNLNSSKTKIFSLNNEKHHKSIQEHLPESLTEIEQINSLLKTKRKRDVQKAVHMTYRLFKNTIHDEKDEEEYLKKRRLGFCIEKLQQFARVPGLREVIDFDAVVKYVFNQIKEQPWLTTSFIKFLRAVDAKYIKPEYLEIIIKILKDENQNIYEGQTYYLWLLVSFHKFHDNELIDYARKVIRITNQNNQTDTAGAYLYLASLDWRKYKSLMIEAVNKGNISDNYFLQRNALIALRMVKPEEIGEDTIVEDLKGFHEKLHLEEEEEFIAPLPDMKYSDIIKDTPNLISLS